MPPGFEHRADRQLRGGDAELITVSMPPGFEHPGGTGEPWRDELLITVSMPPGFEHADTRRHQIRSGF